MNKMNKFQVAFRKEASINGPIKMNKLKTQYDHLLMISEKNYVRKLCLEWMYVPEGGLFDDRVKRIRQFIQELEDILNQSDSTWRDYFNMKSLFYFHRKSLSLIFEEVELNLYKDDY